MKSTAFAFASVAVRAALLIAPALPCEASSSLASPIARSLAPVVDWDNNHNELAIFDTERTYFGDADLSDHFTQGSSSSDAFFAARSLDPVASIVTDKSELERSFQLLTITVNAPSKARRTSGDWVGIYLDGDDPGATAPVRYAPLTRIFPDYNQSSASTFRLSVRLVNMRRPYRVTFAQSTVEPYQCSSYVAAPDWCQFKGADEYKHYNSTIVAFTSPITFSKPDMPQGVRVIPTGNANGDGTSFEFRVQWTAPASVGEAELRYAPTAEALTSATSDVKRASATASTISRSQLCRPPATSYGFRDIGTTYEATFWADWTDSAYSKHLLFFDVGSASDGAPRSPPQRFDFPPRRARYNGELGPAHGTDATRVHAPTSLLLVADMGTGVWEDDVTSNWHPYGMAAVNTSRSIEEEVLGGLDLSWAMAGVNKRQAHADGSVPTDPSEPGSVHGVYHVGDIAYAIGYLSRWEEFLAMARPWASRALYLVNMGNHESDHTTPPISGDSSGVAPSLYPVDDSGGECGVLATSLLKTPRPSAAEPWYSYDIGSIHVVAMSTETDFSKGSPQYAFLENDLRSVDRRVTPWILFGGHRPGYIDTAFPHSPQGTGDIDVADQLQKELGPLWLMYNVTMTLWGHHHTYQRHCSATAGQCLQRPQPESISPAQLGAKKFAESQGEELTTPLQWSVHRDPPAPVHLVVGMGGASYSSFGTDLAPTTEVRLQRHGYVRFSAINRTHLTVVFRANKQCYEEYPGTAATAGYGAQACPAEALDRFLIVQNYTDLEEEHQGGGGWAWYTIALVAGASVAIFVLVGTNAVLVVRRQGTAGLIRMFTPNFGGDAADYSEIRDGNKGDGLATI